MSEDCRHCGGATNGRPRRGLCVRCYYRKGVRDLYPARPLGRPRAPGRKACGGCGGPRTWHDRRLCRGCQARRRREPPAPAPRPAVTKAPPGRPAPTAALPGAEAKILALQARAAARQPLFVAGDARRSLA